MQKNIQKIFSGTDFISVVFTQCFPTHTQANIKNNFNTTNILNFIKLFIELFLKIKKIRKDIIQSYTIVPNLICPIIAYFFKIKSVVMITGMGSIYISHPIFIQKFVDFIYKIKANHSIYMIFLHIIWLNMQKNPNNF